MSLLVKTIYQLVFSENGNMLQMQIEITSVAYLQVSVGCIDHMQRDN